MKVVLLGANGQLAGQIKRCAPDDVNLVALGRAEADFADLPSLRSTLETLRGDVVLNAAAYTAVDNAENDKERAFLINGEAVKTIAGAVAGYGGRLVHISTDYVFDGTASSPYKPDAPTNPQSVYGASKLAGELAVREVLDDKRSLIVRTAWVYAMGGTNFVETVLRLSRTNDRLRIVADQIGTPTSAASLAAGLWSAIERETSGICHFTDAGVASWYDFAVAINQIGARLGLCAARPIDPISSDDFPRPAKRPSYSVLDKSESWEAIGYRSPHWLEALECEIRRTAPTASLP